jgi:ABC-2 type transport system ATP-binding protein
MRCIAALESPHSGSVFVDGLDVHDSPRQAHRLMGYLSDNFGLYGDLTVAQGLTYAALSQGLARNAVAAAVQATAQQLGLAQKLHHLGNSLSRGQRQRLAIGQAIIHKPKVLLLDEPASGLDPEARSSLAHVFSDLQAQGMSLLVSSHILSELDEYSTHMLALHEGQVLEHRALRNEVTHSNGQALERLLQLQFASPIEAAQQWLRLQKNVRIHQVVSGERIDIGFCGTPADQAALIAACVSADHRLTVVMPLSENLQQSYLKSLQTARLGGAT